jgi:mono/diheme cytochrome c family protein
MKKTLKRLGAALTVFVLLALLLFAVAHVKASARMGRKFETHRIDLPLPAAADLEAIARGKHLVARNGCDGCHGADLAGGIMLDDPAIGSIRGPNLTAGRGGLAANYAMADWDRIVRHGVKPDGSPAVMPSEDFFTLSDAELSDIAAYIRSVPAVDAEVPRPSFGPIGKVLVALGKFPFAAEHQTAAAEHASRPPETADTAEFGAHLAALCVTCHRADFAGGPIGSGPPDWPPAANLTAHATGLGDWSYADFERAITEGVRKDGRQLREPMTALLPAARAMLPTERRALWTYLRSLPARATPR